MAKIDCSVTVNFLRKWRRMCDSYGQECKDCALWKVDGYPTYTCSDYMYSHPETAVEIVQKWLDEHPVKTRLKDIKERYPNVPLNGVGTPYFYPCRLGYCAECIDCPLMDAGTVGRCWDEPLVGGATGKAVE